MLSINYIFLSKWREMVRVRRNGFGIFYRNRIDYSVIVEQRLKRIKKKKKKERKGGVREIWNMSTEMQIFVRKLITRINSSQNVQTVCQTGRFYLFSRRQTELCTDIGRLRQMRDACACTCAHPRMQRVLRRFGIKFTRYSDILFEQLIVHEFYSYLYFSLIPLCNFCRNVALRWLRVDYTVTLA